MIIAAGLLLSLLGVILALIPARAGVQIFSVFSFDDFGIRFIRRWNNTTDSLGNFFLFLSLLFCVFYIFIPFYEILYSVWLTFTLLCTLSRTYLCTETGPRWKEVLSVLAIYSIAMAGFLAVMGAFNDRIFVYPLHQMDADIYSGRTFTIWYFLQNISFPYTVFQGFLMMVPLFTLWQQFKYMRLENQVKGHNLVTFLIHTIFVDAFMILFSQYGFVLINESYQIRYYQPPAG